MHQETEHVSRSDQPAEPAGSVHPTVGITASLGAWERSLGALLHQCHRTGSVALMLVPRQPLKLDRRTV